MIDIIAVIRLLMKKDLGDPMHVWLIMLKAMRSVSNYALADIEAAGLGDSDFRVLEVLFHKGPMPVNAIGPRVNLNPGSISVAVDRLYRKGLVSRVESTCDRRVRTVSLTESGKELFVPVFRRHMALIKKAFAEIPQGDLEVVEATLRKIGKRAEVLAGNGIGPGTG